ncbi:MAG: hypothetical protein PHF14_04115 [Verrucomicrobiota bacterium]|nr:hypothetical protein [Verrucomicrobiota bacterium]
MYRSIFAAELCRHRNNTVAIPGFSCPNPIPRSFDTETDSDPDPDLASPWTFLDGLWPESVRRGIRFPDLTSPFPSGSGEPRAEAQRRGGVFELAWGGGAMLKSLPFGEIH